MAEKENSKDSPEEQSIPQDTIERARRALLTLVLFGTPRQKKAKKKKGGRHVVRH